VIDELRWPTVTPRARAAARIVEILDSPFLRVLTEPARLEVLRVLLVHGAGDIGEIAQHLPQDRSVVSRHLRVLEDAGIVSSRRDGRRTIFALEGAGLVGNLERILGEARALAPLCCPPSAPAAGEARGDPAAAGKAPRRAKRPAAP
jgi:DNA-binding transcriptional ArsR family regulator